VKILNKIMKSLEKIFQVEIRMRNVQWKMRKKCTENIFWIFTLLCFLSQINNAHGNYAEGDDLVNELDRPSKYLSHLLSTFPSTNSLKSFRITLYTIP
jgi:hypothetical protein